MIYLLFISQVLSDVYFTDGAMHTYELQAPGKNPQTFIYYEDAAAWLMIKTNLVNKQIYF